MNLSIGSRPEHTGPFRATRIWNGIVAYTREHVLSKQHTVKHTTYDNCFTGCDIVDVVYHYLLQEKESFPKKPTREKAVKACQVMLDFQIIESVITSSDVEQSFVDTTSRLYRLCAADENIPYLGNSLSCNAKTITPSANQVKTLPRTRLGSDSQTGSSPAVLRPGLRVMHELNKFSQLWRRHSTAGSHAPMVKSHAGSHAPVLQPRVSMNHQRPASDFSSSVSDTSSLVPSNAIHDIVASAASVSDTTINTDFDMTELSRETALYALTQMIDLPILDSIISACMNPTLDNNTDTLSTTFTNPHALKRYKSICTVISDTDVSICGEDGWWMSALCCLQMLKRSENVPSIPSLVHSNLSPHEISQHKMRMFTFIADCYTATGCRSQSGALPLWSGRFSDIHKECYRLLMEGHDLELLRVMQCALALVDHASREEMSRLIRFLHHVVSCSDVQLCSSESNEAVVLRLFTSALMRSDLLAQHQLGQLMTFMLSHSENLWILPDDVSHLIQLRLSNSPDKSFNNSTLERSYCQRVSSDEFCRQKAVTTEKCLVDMINGVIDNTQISLKEKSQLLENFKRHHAELWMKHFSHIA